MVAKRCGPSLNVAGHHGKAPRGKLLSPTGPGKSRRPGARPGKAGVCVRGVISPLISNVYLSEIDKMLEKAIETTRYQQYTAVQYARFADDLVVLVDSHARHGWIVAALKK
jgi:hypothetical protein